MKVRANDSMLIPGESAGVALASLARLSFVCEAGWKNGRISWMVDVPPHEELCAHLKVRRVVERSISTHEVVK